MKIMCFFIVLFLLSCATPKWKTNYSNKNIEILRARYNLPADYEFMMPLSGSLFVDKPYRRLNRRDVKKNLKAMEKIYATIPDSLRTVNENIDSFYTNKYKKQYIIAKKLQSPNIHFY